MDGTRLWWHAATVPGVDSMEALLRAVAEFEVADLDLQAEPSAVVAAQRSLGEAGLLLLGEVHGVRENPLIIRALLRLLGLTSLALEWPADLGPVVAAFLAGGALADHPQLWLGDGRLTAGHLAVLADLARAGPLELTLFDGAVHAGSGVPADVPVLSGTPRQRVPGRAVQSLRELDVALWSRRDAAMAACILESSAGAAPTLVVAGNAHTPLVPGELGVPMGAQLAQRRPGLQEMRISYLSGHFYNFSRRRFATAGSRRHQPRLYEDDDALILDLPAGREATVPTRPPGQAASRFRARLR